MTLGDSVPAARPFLASAADEPSAELSPDGRYLAYESNQSGRAEVYVQPFPGSGRREVVSIDGGVQPAWARNGQELFYRVSQGAGRPMQMMAVDVSLGDVFTAKRPRVLWEAMGSRYPGGTGRTYDVAPDGRRFLMVQQRDAQPQPPITHVVLVQNWLEELKRLVPRD